MTKKRSPYKAEFREKLVLLSRKGRSSSGLSREFGPSPQTIINWVRQADLDEGRPVAGATDFGWRTRRTFRPWRGSCPLRWCWTCSRVGSLAGRWGGAWWRA